MQRKLGTGLITNESINWIRQTAIVMTGRRVSKGAISHGPDEQSTPKSIMEVIVGDTDILRKPPDNSTKKTSPKAAAA